MIITEKYPKDAITPAHYAKSRNITLSCVYHRIKNEYLRVFLLPSGSGSRFIIDLSYGDKTHEIERRGKKKKQS